MIVARGAVAETLQKIWPVSRETLERLVLYVELLRRWQSTTNLIGPGTLEDVWHRHVADSLQLARHAPLTGTWVDLGSGGGFPGLVIAIAMAENSDKASASGRIHLIESNSRKAAFLREAIRETQASADVHPVRIEAALPKLSEPVHVVTARALAPLASLCLHLAPLVEKGAIALVPKGQDVEAELTEAARSWNMVADRLPSLTDPKATILRMTHLAPRPVPPRRSPS